MDHIKMRKHEFKGILEFESFYYIKPFFQSNSNLIYCFLGKQCFIVLRQQHYSVQVIAAANEIVSKQMVKFATK